MNHTKFFSLLFVLSLVAFLVDISESRKGKGKRLGKSNGSGLKHVKLTKKRSTKGIKLNGSKKKNAKSKNKTKKGRSKKKGIKLNGSKKKNAKSKNKTKKGQSKKKWSIFKRNKSGNSKKELDNKHKKKGQDNTSKEDHNQKKKDAKKKKEERKQKKQKQKQQKKQQQLSNAAYPPPATPLAHISNNLQSVNEIMTRSDKNNMADDEGDDVYQSDDYRVIQNWVQTQGSKFSAVKSETLIRVLEALIKIETVESTLYTSLKTYLKDINAYLQKKSMAPPIMPRDVRSVFLSV